MKIKLFAVFLFVFVFCNKSHAAPDPLNLQGGSIINASSIGIGTSEPGVEIDIKTQNKKVLLQVSNGTSKGEFGFKNGGATSLNIGTNSNNSLTLKTSGQSRVTITKDGFVGIGTSAPSEALELGVNRNIRLTTDRNTQNVEGLIQLRYTTKEAKAIIEYYDENNKSVVWLQAHNYLSYPTNQHKHFSIETADTLGLKQTRLGVGYGCDFDCIVHINQSNLKISRNKGATNGNVYIDGGNVFHESSFKFYPRYATNGSAALTIDETGGRITMSTLGSNSIHMGKNVIVDAGYRLGVGTQEPETEVHVTSQNTTTFKMDSLSNEKGACLALKDSDGDGFTYLTVNDGTPSFSTAPCQ